MFSLPLTAFAGDEWEKTYVEYLEDGSYIVTTVVFSDISLLATTKTGSKTDTLYNSNNEKQWSVTLTGTFSYTGSSATCTNSKTSYQVFDSSWKVTSSAASKSGRTAKGEFTVKKYVLGIATKTEKSTITISCSNSGVLS